MTSGIEVVKYGGGAFWCSLNLSSKVLEDSPIYSYIFLITLKEALYIRVNNPSLNRNVGKYHLPHIWDEVLLNIPELKLK